MHVNTGIHLSVLFIKEGTVNMEVSARFEHTEKACGEPKERMNSVVGTNTLDLIQAEDKITSLIFIAKGDLLHEMIGRFSHNDAVARFTALLSLVPLQRNGLLLRMGKGKSLHR